MNIEAVKKVFLCFLHTAGQVIGATRQSTTTRFLRLKRTFLKSWKNLKIENSLFGCQLVTPLEKWKQMLHKPQSTETQKPLEGKQVYFIHLKIKVL